MEISTKKLIISASLIIILGVIITIFSINHTEHMGVGHIEYPLFLYGTAIISLAVGGTIVYLFEEKINKLQLNKILMLLPNDERKVLQLLIERNELEQRKLGTLTELNTVKISRIISTLEQRGVIEKKKQGYTNLIVLKINQ